MKNIALLILPFLLFACKEKCYRCANQCKACYETHQDTTLSIIVCSDVFGEDYFAEYVDSLTSPALGWICYDTLPNRQERFCKGTNGSSAELLMRKEAGWRCASE